MNKPTPKEALKSAIALSSTLRAFAGALHVNYQTVQQWLANRVPAEYCPTIERLTDGEVRCEELRPDVDWAYLRAAAQCPDSLPSSIPGTPIDDKKLREARNGVRAAVPNTKVIHDV